MSLAEMDRLVADLRADKRALQERLESFSVALEASKAAHFSEQDEARKREAEIARLRTELEETKEAAARTCYQGGAAAGELLAAKDAEIVQLKAAPRELPFDPNGNLWIGYCDLCNGQHCVTILDRKARVERAPHRTLPTDVFEVVARAARAYLAAQADLAAVGVTPDRPIAARRLADAWIALTKACAQIPEER